MSIFGQAARQLRHVSPVLIAVNVVVLAVLVIAVVQDRAPAPLLLRDPSNITRQPFYLGLLSNAGVLLWCAAAVTCLFAATLTADRRLRWFLVASGLLTALLGLDDLFVLHETVFPVHLGVHERLVVGVYGIAALAYLIAFYRIILQTDFLLLAVAGFFFAWSLSLDFRFWFRTPFDEVLDDGLKLIGIANWCAYYIRTSHQIVTGRGPATVPAGAPVVSEPALETVPASRAALAADATLPDRPA
jgi:hypothetical protein